MKRNKATIFGSASICLFAFLSVRSLIVGLPRAAIAQSTQGDSASAPAAAQASEHEVGSAAPAAGAASDRKTREVPELDNGSVLKAYAMRNADVRNVFRIVAAQFAGRAKRITINEGDKYSAVDRGLLVVYAPEETHAEIRGLINYLDQPPAPAKKDTPAEAFMRYLNLRGVQKPPYQERLDAGITKLRKARSDDETQTAKTALRQLLEDVFSEDMQARDEQVKEIERRLEKLRKQYSERQKVRDEIVESQLKVLEREAQGLGFPRMDVPDMVRYRRTFRNRDMSQSPSESYDSMTRGELFEPFGPASRAEGADRRRREHTLDDLRKTNADMVEWLQKRGHFIESPDRKLYAYVNANYPAGPSELVVADAATGKFVATANFRTVIGPLEFTDEGVATRETDGTRKVRIDLSKERDAQNTPPTNTAEPVCTLAPAPASHQVNVAEYTQLRDQYVKTKAEWQRLANEFEAALSEARKQQPDASVDDLKKQHPARGAVEEAQRAWESAQRLLEAKRKLLELDCKAARIARDAAADAFAGLTEISERNPNAVSPYEVDAKRRELESAEVEMERTSTLYELFKSISDVAPDASGSSATDSKDDGQQTDQSRTQH